MKRAVQGGVAVIASAAIGGALMYLLDPEVGQARRRRMSAAAHDAVDRGSGAVGAAMNAASIHAGHAADHLRDHLSSTGDSLHHFADDAMSSARAGGAGLLHSAASRFRHLFDRAHDARDHVKEFANQQLRRVGNALPHDREHHYVGQTACALSSLALGAGAVYFLDPQSGRRRRAEARQRFFKAVRTTGHFFGATGRHLRNKMTGKIHQMQSAIYSHDSDESELEQPTSLGNTSDNANAVPSGAATSYGA